MHGQESSPPRLVSEDAIRLRAYHRFLERGRAGQEGNELDDWLRAETELAGKNWEEQERKAAGILMRVTTKEEDSITVAVGDTQYIFERIEMGHNCGNERPIRVGDELIFLRQAENAIAVRFDTCPCPHVLAGLRDPTSKIEAVE